MKTTPILATFVTQLLLLPADLQVEEVLIDQNRLIVVLSSTQLTAACPYCSSLSARVHSRYTRTLVDLPSQERAVVLRVQVRRFFCLAAACAHQTFAEQFPTLAPAYARRTHRQLQRLRQIAFALGGRPGARLVKQQAMPISFSTLVRLIRRSAAPRFPSPHVLGIDDFALKKGEPTAPYWWSKLMIVTVDEQQKPVTSASIAILSICLQQTCSTPCGCGSLCAHREPHPQGVLRISDIIGSAT